MKRITQLLLLLPLLWAAGCQKEAPRQENEGTEKRDEAVVKIHASLANPANATKAIIHGTDIPDGFTYGIFVCKAGTTDTPHKANSWNVSASFTAGTEGEEGRWSYQYINPATNILAPTQYDNITITAPLVGAPEADLYAYAPYITKADGNNPQKNIAFDPTAIPFAISQEIRKQDDLMYAEENATDVNKGLNPLSESNEPLKANFTFKHALALLAFEFEIKNYSSSYSSSYRLKSITVKKKNPEANTTAQIYRSGTFNAITGNINYDDCTSVDALTVSQLTPGGESPIINPNKLPAADHIAYMALVPTELEDDELEVLFVFNETDRITAKPFVIKKQYVKHGDGETYGFQGGYKYTFRFTMDNYLYLKDFDIEPWDDTIIPIEPVEI